MDGSYLGHNTPYTVEILEILQLKLKNFYNTLPFLFWIRLL